MRVDGLVVKPGENIHLGLPYKDAEGNGIQPKVTTYPIFKSRTKNTVRPLTPPTLGKTSTSMFPISAQT